MTERLTSLKADGFAAMVASVADAARNRSDAAECIRIAVTLDGRLAAEIGERSLTAAERLVTAAAARHGARLDPAGGDDVLALTATGRLRVAPAAEPPPDGGQLLGSLVWPAGRPPDLERRRRELAARDAERWAGLRDWLAAEPGGEVRERVERIAYALVHMAPVLIYVGDRCYTNLGRYGTLPGNSVRYGSQRCQLTGMLATPVVRWPAEDACFVACLAALLCSGPPVRAEEFNGVQLDPASLEEFLVERITSYGAAPPVRRAGEPVVPWLDRLAAACAERRLGLLRAGATFYRGINGLSLHKREHLMTPAVGVADVPEAVLAGLSARTGHALSTRSDAKDVAVVFQDFAARVVAEPAPARFRSAYEAFLHELLVTVAEATRSDVAMARGPRVLAQLHADDGSGADPLRLATRDCYCCVVASATFTERFGADRDGLVRALAAYSARMRFNTWHYLPHSLNIHDRRPGREDWYFAPNMPDVTEWSDQHHTGHVQFGVRYAIRVPVGIDFAGAHRPGLYDLRLLRTGGFPFTHADLRAAVAVGQILRALHEAMAGHDIRIDDFDNPWYREFYREGPGPA